MSYELNANYKKDKICLVVKKKKKVFMAQL